MPDEADPRMSTWGPVLELYAAAVPRAQVRRLAGRDHQLNNDLSEVARDIREVTSRAAERDD